MRLRHDAGRGREPGQTGTPNRTPDQPTNRTAGRSDSRLQRAALALLLSAAVVCSAACGAAQPGNASLLPAWVATPGGSVPTPPVLLGFFGGTPPPTPPIVGRETPTLMPEPETPAAADQPQTEPLAVVDAQAALIMTAEAAVGGLPTPTSPPPSIDPPVRVAVNGVAYEAIVVLPEEVVARGREIAAAGRAQGRNPAAFSKVGDSTIQNPHFLARFDDGLYNLGEFGHLQPVIDRFRGSHGREGAAVRLGLHSWSAVDPAWADKTLCGPGETPVACEIRLHNPSILLIRLGTNDVGVGALFEESIRQIVDTAISAGVVPVIGTKADRREGSNENNDTLRRIAAEYRIPLWDFDQVANTLPGRGLDVDYVHMNTFFAHDYSDPTAFGRGHAMHNLTALMMLDALWRLVLEAP